MKCLTKFCRGQTFKNHKNTLCPKCRSRRWKDRNPLRYFFGKLKNRARERGKEFSLTFDEYKQFCAATDYDKLKGKTKYSLSINRKNPSRGYHFDNIEAITLSLNSRLQFTNMPDYLKAEMEAAIRGGAEPF